MEHVNQSEVQVELQIAWLTDISNSCCDSSEVHADMPKGAVAISLAIAMHASSVILLSALFASDTSVMPQP